ncbi:hypothetical protein P8935_05645 [Telmatobacter sp. DSM 110680]|uniref:Cytochrome c domain-containing protein n=1 Tax=Telmatobacter sp. DSM 110680 TaxID=3036704 RepID=A0AAU7DNA3_9BACT
MTRNVWLKIVCTGAVVAAVFVSVSFSNAPGAKAQSGGDSRIQIGMAAAPVPLNMKGKNPALVGLGSYFVNVVGDCNGCHSNGPQTEYVPGKNPYFNQPKMVNTATYLGGGRDFGALIPGSAHIISRNLTPDASGLPEGGNTFQQFLTIMRTGADLDHRHPNCTGAPNAGCIPAPFDGNLLQVMPWPNLKDLSDNDLRAIYEYLGAVPCIQGNDAYEPANRCE